MRRLTVMLASALLAGAVFADAADDAEAKRRGVPAFRIFTDQALRAIAASRPATARELLSVPGIGLSVVEKYGAQIFRILHEAGQ